MRARFEVDFGPRTKIRKHEYCDLQVSCVAKIGQNMKLKLSEKYIKPFWSFGASEKVTPVRSTMSEYGH